MNNEYYFILLYLVQIISLYNAISMGWTVKKIGVNKYELSTKNKEIGNIELSQFMINIVSIGEFI